MSINVNFKKELGYIQTRSRKITIYESNCLAAMCYEENNHMELWSFFADKNHASICLGLQKGYNGVKENIFENEIWSVTLNIKYPDMLQLAKLFAKAKILTNIYYE